MKLFFVQPDTTFWDNLEPEAKKKKKKDNKDKAKCPSQVYIQFRLVEQKSSSFKTVTVFVRKRNKFDCSTTAPAFFFLLLSR